MKRIIEKFVEHPNDQGETYLEHLSHALQCSALFSVAASACLVHAFLPFMFKEVATSIAKGVISKRCKVTNKIL